MYSRAVAGSILALGAGNALAGGVSWAGLNIAGMDFGCTTDVSSPLWIRILVLTGDQGNMRCIKSGYTSHAIPWPGRSGPDEAFYAG